MLDEKWGARKTLKWQWVKLEMLLNRTWLTSLAVLLVAGGFVLLNPGALPYNWVGGLMNVILAALCLLWASFRRNDFELYWRLTFHQKDATPYKRVGALLNACGFIFFAVEACLSLVWCVYRFYGWQPVGGPTFALATIATVILACLVLVSSYYKALSSRSYRR